MIRRSSFPVRGWLWENLFLNYLWPSATNHLYSVSRADSLTDGFSLIQEHIAGTPPLNSYTDPTTNGAGPFFYLIIAEPFP
jgi:hypothetical protein